MELADHRRERHHWDSRKDKDSGNESVKTYEKKRNVDHRLMEKMEENSKQLEEEYTILSVEAHEYDEELHILDKERKGITKEIDRLTSKMTTMKKTFEEFRNARKTEGN